MANFFQNLWPWPTGESLKEEEKRVTKEGVKVLNIGTSGIENYSGYIDEDYLDTIQYNRTRAEIYDKMRRQDDTIARVKRVIENPVKAASWEFSIKEEFAQSDEAKKQQELFNHIFMEDLSVPWQQKIHELITYVWYGFACFEKTFKIVKAHPKHGPYIGLRSLTWLSPKTIERWNLDHSNEQLFSVSQYAYGDANRVVDIPAKFLVHYALDQEGQNFNGISILRPLYRNWTVKQKALERLAGGVEKYGIPIPIVKFPTDRVDEQEKQEAINAMKAYNSGNNNFLLVPHGWELETTDGKFDPEKIQSVINSQDKGMVFSILANFIELGKGGGSFALSQDLSSFFLKSCESYTKTITDSLNRTVVKDLSLYNTAKEPMVELKVRGISDRIGKELGILIKDLVGSGVITGDDELESSIRKRLGLPAHDKTTARELSKAPQPQEPNEEIQFAESSKKKITKNIDLGNKELKGKCQELLQEYAEEMIKRAETFLKKGEPGTPDLKQSRSKFAKAITPLLQQVREKQLNIHHTDYKSRGGTVDFPRKFSEKNKNKYAKTIRNVAEFVAISQLTDLEKTLGATYLRISMENDSIKTVAFGMRTASEKYINSASVNAAVQNSVTQTAFAATKEFSVELKEQGDPVISYTFINTSPVASICQYLANKTIRADSSDVDRYMPPLHFNCKTSMVINTASTKNNPKDVLNKLSPSKSELDSASLVP